MRALACLMFGLTLSAAAQTARVGAVPTVSIAPGETVTVRVADGQTGFIVVERSQGGVPRGRRAGDTVRFSFSEQDGNAMLNVENGYAEAFDYRARIHVGSRSARTSICTVMPRISTMEVWPDRIDRIELSEPRLSDGSNAGCR